MHRETQKVTAAPAERANLYVRESPEDPAARGRAGRGRAVRRSKRRGREHRVTGPPQPRVTRTHGHSSVQQPSDLLHTTDTAALTKHAGNGPSERPPASRARAVLPPSAPPASAGLVTPRDRNTANALGE